MKFSEFVQRLNDLERRLPERASVCAEVEAWTYRDAKEPYSRLGYRASLIFEDDALIEGCNSPELALDKITQAAVKRFGELGEPMCDPLEDVDTHVIQLESEAAHV